MGNISDKLQYLAETKKAIKEAIESKEVPVVYTDSFRSYADKIMSIPQERRAPDKKSDVTFYDYDGTILHSYTKEAFLARAEMPELPTRVGLICQGWNYEYEDARAYVAEYGVLDVGATYITDDGKTRLYITIAAEGRMDVPIKFKQTEPNGGVVVNWGDGSDAQTYSGSNVSATHHYESIGDYVITLEVTSGRLEFNGTSIIGNPNGTTFIPYLSILKKAEIGGGVTIINDEAFRQQTSLSSVVIPNGVTSIGSHAFRDCYSLSSVVIPNGVTSIGSQAFSDCYSLSSIVIPNGVTSIANAFYNCCSLSSVVIPNSVTSIAGAFSYCYSLSSVVIPNGVTSIGSAFSNCRSLSSVVIPNGVTSIGSTFSDCYSLSSVVIPNSVTSIESQAFYNCCSLSSVVIPNGVTSIGQNAFYNCCSLSLVVIPNSVTSIGKTAFASCYGVAFYDFSAHESVPTLANTNAFSSIASDCKIIVPDALYDSWIAASNWSTYASKIVKASEYNG